MPSSPYYLAYDARYRSVYAQGVTYWSAFPEELAAAAVDVSTLLADHRISPPAHIAEFGCGEAFLGPHLAALGYRYTGLDISPAAVAKARIRLASFPTARVLEANILESSALADASIDAALDVQCLHMLLLDADRVAYLRAADRVLKPGAPMLFHNQSHRVAAPDTPITSFEQWCRISGCDYQALQERDAWEAGRRVRIRLPLVPARARSLAQYRRELEAAGFAWLAPAALDPAATRISFRVQKR